MNSKQLMILTTILSGMPLPSARIEPESIQSTNTPEYNRQLVDKAKAKRLRKQLAKSKTP